MMKAAPRGSLAARCFPRKPPRLSRQNDAAGKELSTLPQLPVPALLESLLSERLSPRMSLRWRLVIFQMEVLVKEGGKRCLHCEQVPSLNQTGKQYQCERMYVKGNNIVALDS